MSSIANLVIADATPTNHTFYPIKSGMDSQWITHEGANALVQGKLVLVSSLASAVRATDKFKMNFSWPFAKTVDGVVSVRSTPRILADVILPDDMTAAERLMFWTMFRNACAAALVAGTITDRDIPM